jgi:hypothetical protein
MLQRRSVPLFFVLTLSFYFLWGNSLVQAEFSGGSSMSSDNFKILDAQHGAFSSISSASSSNFILLGSLGDIAIGSSSISNFKLNSGFLYYPTVRAPVLNTPTPGNSQVSLSWSAALGFQGYSVSGYNLCVKEGTSGVYTCQDVGQLTSFTKTGLSGSTLYTFPNGGSRRGRKYYCLI